MDFLRNGGAEQRVKSLRSWSSVDQGRRVPPRWPLSHWQSASTFLSGRTVSITFAGQMDNKDLDGTADTGPPFGPPFARLLSEHTELVFLSGRTVN